MPGINIVECRDMPFFFTDSSFNFGEFPHHLNLGFYAALGEKLRSCGNDKNFHSGIAKVEVLYAFNDAVADMACVSMTSMLCNTDRHCRIHIFENRLSDGIKGKIKRLENMFNNAEVVFHHIGDELVADLPITEWAMEMWYRVLAPEVLEHSEKIIYLDSDTVVDGDISKMWDIDLGGHYAAVAKHRLRNGNKAAPLGLPDSGIYFNSGVVVFNLSALRKTDLLKRIRGCHEELRKKLEARYLPDQDVLNYLFKGNIILLPPGYNFTVDTPAPFAIDHDFASLDEWGDAFKNPLVIHYVGRKPRPLTRIVQKPFWQKFYAYKARSPYAEEKDAYLVSEYLKFEEMLKNPAYMSEFYIEKKYYDILAEAAERLPGMMAGKKLAIWGAGAQNARTLMAILASKGVNADIVVDGYKEKWGTKIFHYEILPPSVLENKSGEYFVFLAMLQNGPAGGILAQLRRYGFGKDQCYYAFSSVWDILNKPFE
jgi:lipopolysaccharide biosynthesis glycosyltransferase